MRKQILKSDEPMTDLFHQAEEAAEFIRNKANARPAVVLILGSGLGGFADSLSGPVKVDYQDIPHFPRSTAAGHEGRLVAGKFAGHPVIAMQGRFHLYEGYSAQQVAFPVRVFALLGVHAAVLTNAAGGINPDYGQGELVVIKDHINLQGQNPLAGPEEKRLGPRFIDMTDAYYKHYRELALQAGRRLGMNLEEGVYAGLPGPSYETPAEVRFLRAIGADLVGMSTISEVIAARQMGIKVLGISCVANMAAGIMDKPLTHQEVLETGRRAAGQFQALLREVIPAIAADVAAS